MTDDPFKEASKYNTAVRREKRRHGDAIQREAENHAQRLLVLRSALSPAAARIVVAAEAVEIGERLSSEGVEVNAIRKDGVFCLDVVVDASQDPNPAPDWMNREPPPLAPGSLIEVEHKAKARRS